MTLIKIIRWTRRTGAAVMEVQDLGPPTEMETIMKNFAITTVVSAGLAAAALGFAGHAAADTGIDASSVTNSSDSSTSLVRNYFVARPTTYASPATTWVPWEPGVPANNVDVQPWSSLSG